MDCKSTRLLHAWDSSGKNTGMGCHFLLQGIFLIGESNPGLLCLLHCRQTLYLLSHRGSTWAGCLTSLCRFCKIWIDIIPGSVASQLDGLKQVAFGGRFFTAEPPRKPSTSISIHVIHSYSFIWLHNTPLTVQTIVYFFVPTLLGTWVVSIVH